jgi:hypothetical protein
LNFGHFWGHVLGVVLGVEGDPVGVAGDAFVWVMVWGTDDVVLVLAGVVAGEVAEELIELEGDLRLKLRGLSPFPPVTVSFFAFPGSQFSLHSYRITS